MSEKKKEWDILVVDDEQDIHDITKLALKNKKWKSRGIKLHTAFSAKEATEMLKSDQIYQVALIDVVMETADAGLKLSEYIRENLPKSLRIILRTGQPGQAPKEKVLNEYDIDYYMAKTEITPESLFNVIRACLRSYEDVSTI